MQRAVPLQGDEDVVDLEAGQGDGDGILRGIPIVDLDRAAGRVARRGQDWGGQRPHPKNGDVQGMLGGLVGA